MLREIQHSSLDGPRARGKNTWAAENPAVWKSETGLPWCLPSFSAELTSFLLIMPCKKIPIINRGCNAFRYSSPSVQKIASSIFFSEGSFGGKTTMSFLCWFSFFAFILENDFRSTGGVWGVRASLGSQGLGLMWLWEGTGARRAPAEGCRSCWEDSAVTSVWGHVPGYLTPQGAAILCHTLRQTLLPPLPCHQQPEQPPNQNRGGKCHVCHPQPEPQNHPSVLSPTRGLAARFNLWPLVWCPLEANSNPSIDLQGVRPSSGVELQ